MTNKRKAERIKAMTFTTVYDLDNQMLLGFLGDLTLEGAMVVGEKQIKPGRNVKLKIEFLIDTNEAPDMLIIPSHIAWCRKENDSSYYNTGLEFLEMSIKNKNVIEALVIKYKFSGLA